jgi:hypothetical protein
MNESALTGGNQRSFREGNAGGGSGFIACRSEGFQPNQPNQTVWGREKREMISERAAN